MAELIKMGGTDMGALAKRIKSGEVFVYPTDTVYGIGCDATNEKAVRRIVEIKDRDAGKPLSVAFCDVNQMLGYVSASAAEKREIAGKLPGPYTFIITNKSLPKVVTAGFETVGARVPDYAPILRLIKAAGVPIITTSANISGKPPACSVDEVPESVLKKVDFALDGGKCCSGKPSTVIDLATGKRLR